MSQGSLIEQRPRHTATDVTDEYMRGATPKMGKITRDEGYNEKIHKNEIDFADWLHNCFGGEIKLIEEDHKHGGLSPDFIWNDKYWELKSPKAEKSANPLIRKGLRQIEDNPGGIFLDFGNNNVSLDMLLNVIEERMQWYKGIGLDIMIVQKGQMIKVLRYKNRGALPQP